MIIPLVVAHMDASQARDVSAGLSEGSLRVWWCDSPDGPERVMARYVSWLQVKNYRDVAGVVLPESEGWPTVSAVFIHKDDKSVVVQRTEEARLNRNRGTW